MWEYTSAYAFAMDSPVEKANKLGQEGWEVFGFTPTKQGLGWSLNILVLKREVKSAGESKRF